jgi:hypothetical protein
MEALLAAPAWNSLDNGGAACRPGTHLTMVELLAAPAWNSLDNGGTGGVWISGYYRT